MNRIQNIYMYTILRKKRSWKIKKPTIFIHTCYTLSFADEALADKSIDLAGSNCRNPSRSQHKLWCFVQQQGKIVKEECDVPACGKSNEGLLILCSRVSYWVLFG